MEPARPSSQVSCRWGAWLIRKRWADQDMSFTAEDVIEHLERCGREPYRFFIDLSHGYFFNATTSLHLYADDGRWAMIFETAGYGNRSRSIQLELFWYGNCLRTYRAPVRTACSSATWSR